MAVSRGRSLFLELDKQIVSSYNLIKKLDNLNKQNKDKTKKFLLSKVDITNIVELSFIKVFIAWEQFLEESFLKIIVNSRFKKNKTKCYISPKSIFHAKEILKEGRQYSDWSNLEYVMRVSEAFLKDGEPYHSSIGLIRKELDEIKIIRNFIVHKSPAAEEKFKNIVRTYLGTCPLKMVPGKFLFTTQSLNPSITFFNFYTDKLKIAAVRIVNQI